MANILHTFRCFADTVMTVLFAWAKRMDYGFIPVSRVSYHTGGEHGGCGGGCGCGSECGCEK